MTRRRRSWLLIGSIMAAVVLLVGIAGAIRTSTSASGQSDAGAVPEGRSTSDVGPAPLVGPALPAAGAATAEAGGTDSKPTRDIAAAEIPVPPQGGRAVVRSARISLEVTDATPAAQVLREAVLGAGGQVADEKGRDGVVVLTLRVPVDRLDGVLSDVTRLGLVKERSTEAQDVTEQVVDLESRLATQRASVARVRALLERATSIGEIVQIESELTSREGALESLQGRLAALSSRVAMSTLRVELRPTSAPAADDGGFLAGLSGGWEAFLSVGGTLFGAVGAALPFLALAGALALAFLAVRRWLRARPKATQPTPVSDSA